MRGITRTLRTGIDEVVDVLPHYAAPDTWLSAVRVLLSFMSPLVVGILCGNYEAAFPIGLTAGMVALADPRGSFERRGVTMLAAIFVGIVTFTIGTLVAPSAVLRLVFAIVLSFGVGIAADFGTAGIRGTFFTMSVGFMASSVGTSEPIINQMTILSGGVAAPLWTFAVFKGGSTFQMRSASERVGGFASHLLSHLKMETAVGRHAYRIAISVGLASIVTFMLGMSQYEWAAMAAAALYYPSSPIFYKRGIRFIVSTILAALLGFGFITVVHDTWLISLFVGGLLFLATAMRSANYAFFSLTNTLFYILVIMLSTGVGGWGLLFARIVTVAIGIGVAIAVASFTLPARERIALITEMGLPIPGSMHIDDPAIASLRTREVIDVLYNRGNEWRERRIKHLFR